MKRTFTLDISKWRCGIDEEEGVQSLGSGQDTALLNSRDRMCCLGQFSLQCKVDKKDLLNSSSPEDLDRKVPTMTKLIDGTWRNTAFSNLAMAINDDEETTIAEKVKRLKSLCSKYSIQLKIKGKIPKPE